LFRFIKEKKEEIRIKSNTAFSQREKRFKELLEETEQRFAEAHKLNKSELNDL